MTHLKAALQSSLLCIAWALEKQTISQMVRDFTAMEPFLEEKLKVSHSYNSVVLHKVNDITVSHWLRKH